MVEVTLLRDSRRRLSSFFARGHAGWADSGSDVVCAAISALLQAAWLGLTEVAGFEVEAHREKGEFSLVWPAAARSDAGARAIVETAARSLEALAQQYPQSLKVLSPKRAGAVSRKTGKPPRK